MVISFSCKESPVPLSVNFDVEDNWKSFRSIGKNVSVLNAGDKIWVGTTRGLWTTRLKEGVLTKPVLVDNIPFSTVRDIKMDASGMIWVATYSGVYRINQQNVKRFTTEDGLLQNSTDEFEIDHQSRVWAVSSKGVSLYDGGKWKATDVISVINDSNIPQIEAFAPGADNSLYFAVNNGLWQLRTDGQWKRYTVNDGLISNEIRDVHVDYQGNVWISYRGYTAYPMTPVSFGVSVFDGSAWTYYDYDNDGSAMGTETIESDPDGNIWFANGSLCRFDGQSWTFFYTTGGFYNENISIDSNSEIWIGEQHKVLHYAGETFSEYVLPPPGLLSDDVYDIAASEDGSLWFATAEGVSRYKNDTWENFNDSELGLGVVYAIDVDQSGTVWCGGRWGAARYDGQNWQKIPAIGYHVKAIHAAEDGRIWIGSHRALNEFDGDQWLKHDFNPNIMDITTDEDGLLWMATETSGICKFDGLNFTFFNTSHGLTTRNTYSIYADNDSCIWVGTAEDICKYDRSAYHYTPYSLFNTYALANPGFVKCIYKDDSGKFYFGTTNTVATFVEHWATISVADGLINNNVRAIEADSEGNIWFGTAAGISRYSPEE